MNTNSMDVPLEPSQRNVVVLVYVLTIFFAFIPSLVMWILYKDSPAVSARAKDILNFQLTILLAGFVSAVLTVILVGFLLLLAVGIFHLVITIVAAMKVANNENYRFPMTIHFFH